MGWQARPDSRRRWRSACVWLGRRSWAPKLRLDQREQRLRRQLILPHVEGSASVALIGLVAGAQQRKTRRRRERELERLTDAARGVVLLHEDDVLGLEHAAEQLRVFAEEQRKAGNAEDIHVLASE